MATKTYSQEITDTQVMLSGIKNNQKILAERKIDENFTADLQKRMELIISLNNEQEMLKAKLKEKTEELKKEIAEMKVKTSQARKIIKMDMPQASWKEFGITDKR